MYQPLTESAIIAEFYKDNLDEGLGDLLKKAVTSIKKMSSAVKNYMLSKADQISAWVDKAIFEPLKKHLSKFIPGYKFGSNKTDMNSLIEQVITSLAKANGQVVESTSKFSEIKSKRISEGIKRYVKIVGNSFIYERKNTLVEAGAVGAVLSVIHWSHFAVDLLEIILKAAPSIPFLAGLSSKLLKVLDILKKNQKLSKLVDWWEHGKIGSLPAKDVVNAICLMVGVVEICMGGGIFIILSTATSAAWVIGEKLWHLYQHHGGDKEAKAIKESFIRNSNLVYQ